MTPRGAQLGAFRLDPVNQCLWRGNDQISLSPKAFAVLSYLAERPARLVTKQELLDGVWTETHVTEGVLKRAVLEIRRALSDPVEEPRYIQTLHRRGYRLLVTPGETEPAPPAGRSEVIGRSEEVEYLDRWFAQAASSTRQIVFLAGEAGLGKTTLLDYWMSGLRERHGGAVVARGRCVQQFGSGEPYLPVFEALDQLGQELGRPLVDVLRSRAPTWLLHMPALVSLQDRVRLREEVFGSTRERMLREITDALEVLSESAPIVIALEDVHWSDPSTVDLLSAIGRRTTAARLMILASYRPAGTGSSPLSAAQNELELHRQCKVLRLSYFTEADTARYLDQRFPQRGFPVGLAPALHRRANGNPLYVVCLADELERMDRIDADASVIQALLPDTLQQMFERQAAGLSVREQDLLATAAVAGETFAVAEVAAALGWEAAEVESLCEDLARRHVILKAGELVRYPDGAESPGYAFFHALCRDAIYRRIPAGRRASVHGKLGRAQEHFYASDPGRVAGLLAGHFELAGDIAQSIGYLRKAADGAAARFANAEAANYLERAFSLLERLRESERAKVNMDLLEQRALMRLTASDMAGAAADFRALADEASAAGETSRHVRALIEIAIPLVFVDYTRVLPALDEAQRALSQGSDLMLGALIDLYRAFISMHLHGWSRERADLLQRALPRLENVTEMRVRGRIACVRAAVHVYAGEYKAASQIGEEAQRYARKAGVFFDFFIATLYLNWAQMMSGDLGAALRSAKAGVEIAVRNQSPFGMLWFNVRLAWAQMEAYEFRGPLPVLTARAADPRVLAVRNNGYNIMLWLGMARFGSGDLEGAWQAYQTLEAAIQAGGMPFQMVCPLLNAQAECAIGRGDLSAARDIAARLLQTSEEHHEFSYAARAQRLFAEICLIECDPESAGIHIERALETLEKCEPTLAEWRIHAAAARIHAILGRDLASMESRERGLAAARRIAATLSVEPDLQRSFLRRATAEFESAAASA